MPVRIVDSAGLRLAFDELLARGAVCLPVADHLLKVGDQQVGGRLQILRRGGRNCRRCSCASVVVGGGTLAGARAGAVQVLAPQQEFDGVIAGGDIGLDAAGLLQRARRNSGVSLVASTFLPSISIDVLAMTLAV